MKIPQYCSVCKAEYEMDIVPTADDDGVLWLQCPVCKGYLPKVKSSLKLDDAAGAADAGPAADEAEQEVPTPPPEDETPSEVEAEPEPETPTEPVVEEAVDVDLDAMAATAPDVEADETPDEAEPVDDPDEGLELLETADVSTAVPYRPWKVYEIGDVLHHLAWDDHGVVLDKEQLPGNRRVLKVRFAEAGLVRLIEDDGSRPA